MTKYAIISLLLLASLPACKTATSDEQIIAYTAPDLVVYDKEAQSKAAKEMRQYCSVTPTVCLMMGDYKVMRDQTRVNKGEYVSKD